MSAEGREERRPHRRDVLDRLLVAGGVVWLGGVTVPAAIYLWPARSRGPQQGELSIDLADLEVGGAQQVQHQGRPLLIIRTGEQEVHALSAICTHLGCVVHWSAEEKKVLCPCHAASFAADGEVLSGPPPRPLPSYETSIGQDRVRVLL